MDASKARLAPPWIGLWPTGVLPVEFSKRFVAATLLLFAAAWLPLLAATSFAPPVDNIEQLTWARSLEWGYYKHPPLPTFLMWIAAQCAGLNAWTSYLLGAGLTLGAIAIVWRFLWAVRGPAHAGVALLAMLCITFYNGRLYYYNHNIVLMVVVAATAVLTWLAFRERRLKWWALNGLAFGLGALTKYQVAVAVAALLCFWVSQGAWKDRVHVRGLVLAALVALAVFMPHLLWLPAHDFGPVHYALDSALAAELGAVARWSGALHWLTDQLFNRLLPAWLLLIACALAAKNKRPSAHGAQEQVRRDADDPVRVLLLCWGLVPLAFMPATGLLFGSDLQLQWGTPFLLMAVPALMECVAPSRWAAVPARFAFALFVGVQALLLVINLATSPLGPKGLRDKHWRTFNARALAQEVLEPARAALGGPVKVIAGAPSESGALALLTPERPLVLIDGRYEQSPWVAPELIDRCGALQLLRSDAAGAAPVAGFPGLYWRIIEPITRGACR